MSFDASGKLDELAASLCALQGELPPVIPTGIGATGREGARKYKYATLADIWRVVQPLLTKHGLSIVQMPCSAPLSFGQDNANVGVTTLLMHRSGSYIASTLWLPLSQITAQGAGSALTYAKRYQLCGVLGVVADDDDDGAAAAQKKSARDAETRPLGVVRTAPATATGPSPAPPDPKPPVITKAQIKRMFAIADDRGWQLHEVKQLLGRHGFESSKDITRAAYDSIILAFEAGTGAPTGEVVE